MDMSLREFARQYTVKDNRLAALSFFASYAAFAAALSLAVWLAHQAWWMAAPAVVVAAFGGVRLYVLQHDCGHHSLFVAKRQNDLAGYALSFVTLTPYRAMQYNHNMHHAYLGNLDHRETTEIYTMTLAEWERADWKKRLWYRAYRNPFVLIPAGAIFVYFIVYRWPKNAGKVGAAGVIAHNLMVAGFFGLVGLLGGMTGVWTLLATCVTAGMIGVFLVYLQHNFEDTYWDRKPELSFERAALQGSSALDLGHWWDVGTGNIAYHDIHHLIPAIPSYRLRKCHRGLQDHFGAPVIRWPEALRSFRLKLWDEGQERLVPFPRAARAVPAAA